MNDVTSTAAQEVAQKLQGNFAEPTVQSSALLAAREMDDKASNGDFLVIGGASLLPKALREDGFSVTGLKLASMVKVSERLIRSGDFENKKLITVNASFRHVTYGMLRAQLSRETLDLIATSNENTTFSGIVSQRIQKKVDKEGNSTEVTYYTLNV